MHENPYRGQSYPGSPPASMWLARVTSCDHTSYCHFCSPITPQRTLPECTPTRILISTPVASLTFLLLRIQVLWVVLYGLYKSKTVTGIANITFLIAIYINRLLRNKIYEWFDDHMIIKQLKIILTLIKDKNIMTKRYVALFTNNSI